MSCMCLICLVQEKREHTSNAPIKNIQLLLLIYFVETFCGSITTRVPFHVQFSLLSIYHLPHKIYRTLISIFFLNHYFNTNPETRLKGPEMFLKCFRLNTARFPSTWNISTFLETFMARFHAFLAVSRFWNVSGTRDGTRWLLRVT